MTNIHSTFFGRGECVIRGGTREPSFFLAVRKERSRHHVLLGDGGTAGDSSVFDAFVPFYGGIPCRFFIACGRPNQERSSPPIPPVLLLLTGEHLEEGEGVTTRGMGPLEWVGTPGVFFSREVGAFWEDQSRQKSCPIHLPLTYRYVEKTNPR